MVISPSRQHVRPSATKTVVLTYQSVMLSSWFKKKKGKKRGEVIFEAIYFLFQVVHYK